MENDKIVLEFEDGTALEYEALGVFPVKGREYAALWREEEGEVSLYRYVAADEEFELLDIEDDEQFALVSAVFEAMLDNPQFNLGI